MKISRFFMMVGIATLLGGQSLFAQSKVEDTSERVKEQIESGKYTIEVNRALPMKGRSIHLTSSYSLEVRGDSVFSYLPYYGRAYSAPYGGGDGLHFEKPLTDYSVSFNKKDKATISFGSRSEYDNYRFNVQIYSNGSATIIVQPTNKQSITYYGELAQKVEKE